MGITRGGSVLLAILLIVGATPARVRTQATTDSAPHLSELEQLRVTLLTTRAQLAQTVADLRATQQALGACYGALGPVAAKADSDRLTEEQSALIADIEKAHPGYMFNAKTGTLMKKPDPPKADPKK
jgi:hypothetical protein